jgi:sterol desaturase/sphingolipid hydroxylase (fatty acid hydroxylase superfamily)
MSETIFAILHRVGAVPSAVKVLLTLLALAAILVPLERLFAARPGQPIRRKTFVVNVSYWFFNPLFTQVTTKAAVVLVLFGLFLALGRPLDESVLDGFGPLARQPLWLQAVEILLLADFIDYWTHRWFHESRAWRFHAIHHSPEEMTWLASSRMHPVNDLVTRVCQVVPVVLLGFSVKGALLTVPYIVFFVILLHSNLNWDFGPLRWVLVSPLYHRWHHTTDPEGIDKNFAGLFPIWDVLFGTAYFPRREPTRFGVNHDPPPESLWGQLLYPFRQLARQHEAHEGPARPAPDPLRPTRAADAH